ncbi:hypothetical protein BO78DRAFT_401683 [Aspergillus sclerotiicarbonarius CBS 121057]|uniref:Secreted protein n=1 Tax=Aspergillus sclerotiicarbonarius (strain CBS 121057 / IBT 28362) TaxID=1448318 RepID=A0A319E3A4_ASPSB|nr:hypothetical protein BO78DRAFT_401683 [Aspergillus sclerotiicarbonarius CBS 121057]
MCCCRSRSYRSGLLLAAFGMFAIFKPALAVVVPPSLTGPLFSRGDVPPPGGTVTQACSSPVSRLLSTVFSLHVVPPRSLACAHTNMVTGHFGIYE